MGLNFPLKVSIEQHTGNLKRTMTDLCPPQISYSSGSATP